MPFVPAPNCVEVEFRMLLDGQKVENTLYLQKPSGWTAAELVTLGNAALIEWTTNYSQCLSSSVQLREIQITDLTSATAPAYTAPAPAPFPTGQIGNVALSNNVSLCISFRTEGRGRSSRGRNYVTGIPFNEVVQSHVSNTHQTRIIEAYGSFQSFAVAQGTNWVVLSRFSGVDAAGKPVPRTVALIQLVKSWLIVDEVVDSQRRRLPKRGQ